jgi:hypothetical protein
MPTYYFSSLPNDKRDYINSLNGIELENYLLKLKRNVGSFYSRGKYEDCLKISVEMEDIVELKMGKQTLTYASCVNNTALMNKLLGKI